MKCAFCKKELSKGDSVNTLDFEGFEDKVFCVDGDCAIEFITAYRLDEIELTQEFIDGM